MYDCNISRLRHFNSNSFKLIKMKLKEIALLVFFIISVFTFCIGIGCLTIYILTT